MRRYSAWAVAISLPIALLLLGLKFGPSIIKSMGIPFSDAKIVSEIIQSLVEVIAIILAGFWTYERFIKAREEYPYPAIQHRAEHCLLENGSIYLSVFVTVKNEGKTKLDLGSGSVVVRQVSPLSRELNELIADALANSQENAIRLGRVPGLFIDAGQRVGWITLGSRQWNELRGELKELEPGQTRELQFGFILVENDVRMVEIISYIKYATSNWESATLYCLDAPMRQSIPSTAY